MTSTDKSILQLTVRVILLSLFAALPCVAIYLWLDPFKVVRQYDDYMEQPDKHPLRIGMNKGMVTLATYKKIKSTHNPSLNTPHSSHITHQPSHISRQPETNPLHPSHITQHPEHEGYDNISEPNAFIFGSSISCYYDANEWRELLRSRGADNVWPFHFDSASESAMSMARKVEYLHNSGAPLDYALVILDPLILANPDQDSPFAIDPPELHQHPLQLEHEPLYPLHYHYTFFRAAMNFDFLKSFIAGHLTGHNKSFGHNPIFEEQPIEYDKRINQESIPLWDSLIRTDPTRFYTEHPLLPPVDTVIPGTPLLTTKEPHKTQPLIANKEQRETNPFIADKEQNERAAAFRRIAEIFKRHNTDFEIIISPNRRGIGLAPADLEILNKIFGKDKVHDFSYTEAHHLRQDTLLYDNTHYRPPFASHLLHRVYTP